MASVPASVQIRTANPDGSDIRWPGRAGTVVGVKYSFSLPGGANQLSFTLQTDPMRRDPAIKVGRQVRVLAGLRPVWDGQLDEPVSGGDGWQVTAHGAGTFGSQYQAWWTGGATWAGLDAPNSAVDQAILAGMRWVNRGDLSPSPPAGGWMGQAQDNGSLLISDMLDLICSRGGLTWKVLAAAGGNVLTVVPLPTAVTRLLVATAPVARTAANVVTAIRVRYQVSNGTTPTYATVLVSNAALAAKYGTTQRYLDLSSAGVDATGSQATSVANKILNRYQQAAWGGPFVVNPGEYLTATGTPVSLATEQAGEVVRLVGSDYGGQAGMGLPATFIAGGYEYDDDTGTATITPFGSVRTDFQALVASITLRTARDDPFGASP